VLDKPSPATRLPQFLQAEIENPLLPGALVQPTNLSPRSIGYWMFSVGCWMLDVFSVSRSPILPFPIGSCCRVSESRRFFDKILRSRVYGLTPRKNLWAPGWDSSRWIRV
jgi:hypothetical protein